MAAARIVEALDEVEHGHPGLGLGPEAAPIGADELDQAATILRRIRCAWWRLLRHRGLHPLQSGGCPRNRGNFTRGSASASPNLPDVRRRSRTDDDRSRPQRRAVAVTIRWETLEGEVARMELLDHLGHRQER